MLFIVKAVKASEDVNFIIRSDIVDTRNIYPPNSFYFMFYYIWFPILHITLDRLGRYPSEAFTATSLSFYFLHQFCLFQEAVIFHPSISICGNFARDCELIIPASSSSFCNLWTYSDLNPGFKVKP